MAKCLLHGLYVATDRRAPSQLLLLYACMIPLYLDRPRLADRLCLCVCMVIVERLADAILGVKHGVAVFVIQFLECYYNNAATC